MSAQGKERGFTLAELMLTIAVGVTLAAMAVPILSDLTGTIKLNEATRMVEREMQDARLRAVSSNRILRVRLNCPATGQFRTVEYLSASADTASNRCSETAYPYPAPDNDLLTRPNYDGPVRTLPTPASVGTYIIQFHPDGTAKTVVSNVAQTMTAPVSITVTRYSQTRIITVNAAGKVQIQ